MAKKLFRIKKWESINFGIEIALFYVSIYFLFWSIEIGMYKGEPK